jgi:glycosyltransferase involved in cell wall biosynthesis
MACGTPVIAYRRGSMTEVLDEGVSGYLVGGIDDAVAAVADAVRLDRRAVHEIAARRFGVDRMVAQYLVAYESLLGSSDS